MKRILMGTKDARDMTSFLRAWGAFTSPIMKEFGVELVRQPDNPQWVMDWTYYRNVDVIYLHRPYNVMDVEIIEQAKLMGIPLWVDLDDDLQSITPDNPVYATYANDQCKAIIELAIKEADVLSVGGLAHQTRLSKEYQRKVWLLPNMVDDFLFFRFLKRPANRNHSFFRTSWRGSESHRIDLLYYEEAIVSQMKRAGEWRFYGLKPYHLDWRIGSDRYGWVPPTKNHFHFYRQFCEWNADLQFVGLLDTEFNRVKSNLGWSDGTLAGSVVVAPNLPEYQRPGVIHYEVGNVKDAERALREARECDREAEWSKSRDWISENILASKVNLERLKILESIK